MRPEHPVELDIWSDYVCPFCYLELPVIDRLKQEFGTQLDVTWHAFELHPDPMPTLDPQSPYVHDVWAKSVYPLAHERGMKLRLPPVQPYSRKAFETAEHAKTQGRFDAMHLALFRAFFEEGKDIGDAETLLDIGAAAGLDMNQLKDMLDAGRYTHRVIDDERLAKELGISRVPLMLAHLAGRRLSESIVLRGAVPYEQLRNAIVHAAT